MNKQLKLIIIDIYQYGDDGYFIIGDNGFYFLAILDNFNKYFINYCLFFVVVFKVKYKFNLKFFFKFE